MTLRISETPRGLFVGVDVGGTFTDICVFDQEARTVHVHKLPSTPSDPSLAVIAGLQEVLHAIHREASEVRSFAHGTTVGTNTLLEGNGARAVLITTAGFRDLLEIGRQRRPRLYDLFFKRPKPLVPRNLRLEVQERTGSNGEIVTPLVEPDVGKAIRVINDIRAEAVAICFLYSFLNPDHERRVRELVESARPDIYVAISSEVLPEFREFERLSTTVVNAYLGPIVSRYVANLEKEALAVGISVAPRIMQSNGGIMSGSTAKIRSEAAVLSGPAAGVIGAVFLAKCSGFENLITFDMGGTSTDVSLVQGGMPRVTTDAEVNGIPIRCPTIDIHTVGAGGGSIAWIDSGGLLKVGPKSAGSHPGPVCYGQGGTLPTVTDATVTLGLLNPSYLLGGRMPLDATAAREAIRREIGQRLRMDAREAAAGIVRIVESNMMLAIRLVSVQRGFDPRDFAVVGFGGAGPLHATSLARQLRIGKVIIPDRPGILCAMGLLVADIRADYVLTRRRPTADAEPEEINFLLKGLETRAMAWLEEEGVPPAAQRILRHVDMKYTKQNYELRVPAPGGAWKQSDLVDLDRRFREIHERTYGYHSPTAPTELVNFRVTAVGINNLTLLHPQPMGPTKCDGAVVGTRDVILGPELNRASFAVYDRDKLRPGNEIYGPAIVEQMDSTSMILPGQVGRVDEFRNLIIPIEEIP